MSERNGIKTDKIVFLVVVMVTNISIVSFLALAYLVPSWGLDAFPSIFRWLLLAFVVGSILFFVSVLGLLTTVVILGRDISFPYATKLRSIAIRYFLPLFTVVGRILGVSRERIQHAFVTINNELVLSYCKNGHNPQKILLLMPHCLQDSECKVKVTYNVQNCKRCGKCSIKKLLELSEEYGAYLAVATGGTIARKVVREIRPDLIIAVACERDLTSGIQDTVPLPVYGIFNRRPFGPCFNTQVDLEVIEKVLKELVLPRDKSRPLETDA